MAHDFGRASVFPQAPKRAEATPPHEDQSARPSGPGARDILAPLRLNPANVRRWLIDRSAATPVANPHVPPQLGVETRIHRGPVGELVADAFAAEAVTIGTTIYAPGNVSPAVLRHELVHAAQSIPMGPRSAPEALEREAHERSRLPVAQQMATPVLYYAPVGLPLFHPALRTLLRAGRWLARRSTNTLSKHVARHGRRIAGRAVHSVFRNPRKIKRLVSEAVRDGARLARSQATRRADEVLEHGGVRVMQQATGTPGKVRTIVEKQFGQAIGTRGERILRVVLDMSGRVVTAFPVDRFLAAGLGAVAVEIFTAKTAEAAERSRAAIEAHENPPTRWGEVVFEMAIDILSLGLLASSPLNEGEDLALALDRIVAQAADDTIREIEARDGIKLTAAQKRAIYELARVAIGAPMEFEGIVEQTKSSERPEYTRYPDGTMVDWRTGRTILGPGPKF